MRPSPSPYKKGRSSVPPDLVAKFADRGASQWTYGQISDARKLMDVLLSPPAHDCSCEETFVDFGSGTGGLVFAAALAGLPTCIGIELVPDLHEAAVQALDQLWPSARSRVELRCEDALSATKPFARATRVFCNNAVWDARLNACVAAHVAANAPWLVSLLVTKKIPADTVAAAGLALTRVSAVGVDWNPSGWPVFLYERAEAAPLVVCVDAEMFSAAMFSNISSQRWHMFEIAASSAAEVQAARRYAAVDAAIGAINEPRGLNAAGCDLLLGFLLLLCDETSPRNGVAALRDRSMGTAEVAAALDGVVTNRARLLYIGGGGVRLMLLAAAFGLRVIGIDSVRERYEVAVLALERLELAAARKCVELRFEDVLTSAEPLKNAAFVVTDGLMTAAALTQLIVHLSVHAPQLQAVATLTRLPDKAMVAAGLSLTRKSAVGVTWDPMGKPLYIYQSQRLASVNGECIEDASYQLCQGGFI
mmetsp:Transcript_29390/g.48729  ORF Transcript_29390/g.48729 Transcript_29390/m.48729 type:complete len:477 (+) Transcript_29390:70-1500(+)|eukprot:CAMPEP_0119299246 /NCGR_PEP_ID=MMETSP1333-20130426/1352_1 /TAXON_ID=418940 /ORGANISM="Scyphosphaera apsteinii, Strain RCC1455" /LENGTH=476 /DNA_ID=CAMNT_0007300617 /DNA_START=84 /DNA_END=1514 /DNA_ORIENTATION=+